MCLLKVYDWTDYDSYRISCYCGEFYIFVNWYLLGVDTTTQPHYMRIAVDNGHKDTIKKLERLLTEFWKLNEPGKVFVGLSTYISIKYSFSYMF